MRAVTAGVLSAALGMALIPFAGVSSSAADTESETFATVGLDTFTVPDGVTELTVTAIGGGGGSAMTTSTGGSGCLVSNAVITVTPGQVVDIFVGGGGVAMRVGGGGGATNVNAGNIGNQVIAGGGGGTTVGQTGGSGCANATGAGGAGSGSTAGAGGSGGIGGSGGGSIGTSGGNGNGGSGGNGGNNDPGTPSNGGQGFGNGYGGSTNDSQEGPGGGGGFGGGGSSDAFSGAGAGGSIGPGNNVTYAPADNGGVWDMGPVNGGSGSVTIEWEPQVPGPLTFANADFGNVDVTDSSALGVVLTNTGGADLTPSHITATGPGIAIPTGNSGTCQVETPIPAGQNCIVYVEWTPTTAGVLTGASLTIAYPGGETASNSVTLTGTAALEPGQTQTPLNNCVLSPKKTESAVTVPLTKANCTTNAGQPIGTRLHQPTTRGDMTTPRLKCQTNGTFTKPTRPSDNYGNGFVYCTRGRLVLRTKNSTAPVTITWKAPATDTYAQYKKKLTLRLS